MLYFQLFWIDIRYRNFGCASSKIQHPRSCRQSLPIKSLIATLYLIIDHWFTLYSHVKCKLQKLNFEISNVFNIYMIY